MTASAGDSSSPPIQKVYLDRAAEDSPWTDRILSRLRGIPCETVRGRHDRQKILDEIRRSGDPIREGKRILFLSSQKGRFLKRCPCSPGVIGCGYYIVNLQLQCPLDCTYCILQQYLAEPWLVAYTNLQDLWRELDVFLEAQRGRPIRVGTGELGDSLALDSITNFSTDLISYFAGKDNVFFELKTKTADIRRLPPVGAPSNIVVSWSLNTEKIAAEEEIGAPPVEERIQAAGAAAELGYRVGFHFDPLIRYSGWAQDYERIIRRLFQVIPASNIAWISLGALRFPPSLKKIIQSRFPSTRIIADEFIPGADGKLRYFRPLRRELFERTAASIRRWGGEEIPLYLCMETKVLWREALKWKPRGKRDVERALSPRSNRR